MRSASDSLRQLEDQFGTDPKYADDLLKLTLELGGVEQAGIGDPALVLRHMDDFRARVGEPGGLGAPQRLHATQPVIG